MTLIQLKYFQTICKYNNITRASAELHVSQPSLSNAVKELEREFGVSLFTRRSRGLELTPEGRYFLDEADKLLEQAEQLTTNMKHMSTTDRTLTLGLPAMSGSLVFTDLLRTLYARSPGTHIQVMENGSLANRSKIMDHTLDAAIITRNGPLPPGIGHVALRHVNICLYLSVMHPLAEKDTVTTDDLDQLPLAMLPEDTFLDHCIDQYYEAHHLKPNIIVRTNQLATIQQLVATNTTAAFLLDHVLEESSDIVKRTVPGLLPAEIDLIWKSSRHLSPHLKNLITAPGTSDEPNCTIQKICCLNGRYLTDLIQLVFLNTLSIL